MLIPFRDVNDWLIASINSVNLATSLPIEIICVYDDDIDSEKLSKLVNISNRVKVIKSPRKGLANSLNFGIQNAQSDFIVRLDSDDLMIPGRIEAQIAYLNSDKEVAAVGGHLVLINQYDEIVKEKKFPLGVDNVTHQIQFECCIAHPAVTFRKEDVIRIGGYRAIFDKSEDHDLWIRLSRNRKINNLDLFVTKYRIHSKQLTNNHYLTYKYSLAARILYSMEVNSKFDKRVLPGFESKKNFDARVYRSYGLAKKEILKIQRDFGYCLRKDKKYLGWIASIYYSIIILVFK